MMDSKLRPRTLNLLAVLGLVAMAAVEERFLMSWGSSLGAPLLLIALVVIAFQLDPLASLATSTIAWIYVAFWVPRHLARTVAGSELIIRDTLWFLICFGIPTIIHRLKHRWLESLANTVEVHARAARSLKESESRARGLIEFAFDAFVAMDEHGRITDWNLQAETMLGWARPEILGRSFADLLIPERHRKFYRRELLEMAAGGDAINRRPESFVLSKDNSELPVELTTYPVRQNGRCSFGVFLHDTSERMSNEQRLRELNQSLERMVDERTRELRQTMEETKHANRLKDEFLAVVSHELRNPLGAILGSADLLIEGAEATTHPRLLEIIRRNAANQTRLINDLLDVSKVATGKLELQRATVDIVALTRLVVEDVRLSARDREIAVELELSDEDVHVSGDPARLQQVLWNLLSNALKFTPERGRVTVGVRAGEHELEIFVKDTGRGIAPEFLPYVFENFRQENAGTTRNFGGLGLGLAIVRHIVDLHGGRCEAFSEGANLGTRVSFFLARLPVANIAFNEALARTPGALDGVKAVLVDDSEDSLYILSLHLQRAGAEVTTASCAADAFLLIGRECPDILISDISMPGEDGYALIRRVRRSGLKSLPAIALTAHARPEELVKALRVGFDLHLAKPVPPELLVRQIGKLVAVRTDKEDPALARSLQIPESRL